jgi:hypothetical protein
MNKLASVRRGILDGKAEVNAQSRREQLTAAKDSQGRQFLPHPRSKKGDVPASVPANKCSIPIVNRVKTTYVWLLWQSRDSKAID